MNEPNTLAERLTSPETGPDAVLWLPLLKLLAEGEPVEVAALAAASSRSEAEVRARLAAAPDVEYDAVGRIVGQGLTLKPTRHHFEVNGNQLYTWCALDTLIFPALLGFTARVRSESPGNGEVVRLTVGPDGVSDVSPAGAVVSLVEPENMKSIRSDFCNQVHFFPSAQDAAAWLDAHPGGTTMPVADAYRLAVSMAGTITNDADRDTDLFSGDTCC